MSETIGAAQVELGVDASGVEAGVAKAKKTIDSLGGSAAKASREASQGVAEIGNAGANSAQKMDAATKRLAESIERQALAMGKTKSEFYAAQAAIKGNEAALAPYIAKLREAEEANKKVGSGILSMQSMLQAAVATFSVRAFTGWIDGAIEAADRMNDLSKSTNLSVSALAGLKLAAAQSGGDLDSVAKSINKLSVNIGKDAEKFAAIGITAKEPIEAFKQLADLYTRISDPQTRAALGAEALGKSWEGAAPMLAEGSKGIQAMIDKGTALSGMTKGFATASDQFNDKVAELKTAMSGTANILAGSLLPLMDQLAEELTTMAANANTVATDFNPLTETFRALIVLGGNVAFVFKGIGTEIGGMAAQLAAFGSGDFKGALNIGKMMKEDAEKARAAFDAWEQRMMNAGKVAKEAAATPDPRPLTAGEQKGVTGFINGEAAKKAASEALQVQKELFAQRLDALKLGLTMEEAAIKLSLERRQIDETEALYAIEAVQQAAIQERMRALAEQYAKTTDRSDRVKISGEMSKLAAESGKAFSDMELGLVKLDAAAQKTFDTLASAAWKDAWDIAGSNDKLQEEISTLGLSTEQLLAYKIEKINTAKVTAEIWAKSLEDTAAGMTDEGEEVQRVKQYYIDLAAAKRKAAEALGDQAILTQQIETARIQRTESIDMWKSVEGAAHETWTAVSRDGTDAFKQIGKTLKASILDMLYQMTVKKWIFNVAANVSGQGVAQSAIGGSGNAASLWNAGSSLYNLGVSGSAAAASFTTFGSMGTQQAAMLAAQNAGLGTAATTATLEAAGASSTMATIGTYAPYVLAALVVADLLSSSGETRGGGRYALGATDIYGTQGTKAATFKEGPSGGQIQGVQDLTTQTYGGINALLMSLGSKTTLTGFQAGAETSDKGRGGVFSGGILSNGMRFGESGAGSNYDGGVYESTSSKNGDAKAIAEQFGTDMLQVTIQALQAATDIPQNVADFIKDIDAESLTKEAAADMLAVIGLMGNFSSVLNDTVTPAMIAAMGGAQAAGNALASYYDLYFSDAEKSALATQKVTAAFADLGIAMPLTRDGFRDLVDGLDLTTASGQATYAALLPLAPAFAAVADQAAAAATAWAGFDAAGLSQMMLDAAFNPQDGMTAAASFGAALEESVRTALISSTVGSIADSIFNTIVVPMVAGAAVSKVAIDGVVSYAQDAINSLAGVLAQLDLSPIISAITPVLGSLTTQIARPASNNSYAAAQQAAAAAAQRAADAQLAAANAVRDSWQGLADSMADTIRAIRGEALGSQGSFASTQAQFAIATAQARAGDQTAAGQLPALARSLVDLGKGITATGLEQALLAAQTAASLETTVRGLGKYGITVPAFAEGTNFVPGNMLATVHQGERIIPAADNRALLEGLTGRDALAGEVRALREEVARLRSDNSAENRAIAGASVKTTNALDRVINGDDALNVRVTT